MAVCINAYMTCLTFKGISTLLCIEFYTIKAETACDHKILCFLKQRNKGKRNKTEDMEKKNHEPKANCWKETNCYL